VAKHSLSLMQLAQQEAARFQHEYVATEHLLLALASMSGTASRAMASRGISYDVLLSTVQQFAVPGLGEVPTDQLPCTPHAKRAIENSVETASGLGHNRVEPEHVLLALIGDDESVAVSTLQRLGVSPESLQQAVLNEAGWH
jgi:ATP-dependent Clp protease ATP-binding subunit ClpC